MKNTHAIRSIGSGVLFELKRTIEDATRRTSLAQLLSLETVELAGIGNAISDELALRREHVLRYGVHKKKR